jgi:hypothetical protein
MQRDALLTVNHCSLCRKIFQIIYFRMSRSRFGFHITHGCALSAQTEIEFSKKAFNLCTRFSQSDIYNHVSFIYACRVEDV